MNTAPQNAPRRHPGRMQRPNGGASRNDRGTIHPQQHQQARNIPSHDYTIAAAATRPFAALALRYAEQGVLVFPCAGKEPAILGGHGYQDATTDVVTVANWARSYPAANPAMPCGMRSGRIVVDCDPRNGGTLAALADSGRALPDTYSVQSGRGDGGKHFYFQAPGYISKRAALRAAKQLGPGWDILADGCYVLLAGSLHPATGKPYIADDADAPIAPCPEWLLDLLRHAEAELAEIEAASAASQENGRYPQPARSGSADDGQFWLARALRKRAEEGEHDDKVGYLLAQQVLIARVPDPLPVLRAYGLAATRNPRDPFSERSYARWLKSAAQSDLVRRGDPARSLARSLAHSRADDERQDARLLSATTSADPLGEWASSSEKRLSGVSQVSAVSDRAFPLMGDDGTNHADADGARTAADPGSLTRRGPKGTFPLLSLDDLLRVREIRPEELIPGKLMKRSLAVLYGSGESGKSYFAQDQCYSLAASGVPVWYVAGEGFDGLYLRILAWLATHPGASLAPLRIIPQPVQIFRGDDRHILAAQARDLPPESRPALVVLDTLHRCVTGADENSNSDMGCLAQVSAIWRSEFGATLWAIHHEGKSGGGTGPRGASCLYDDADSVQYIFRGGDISVVEAEKQKDGISKFEAEAFTVERHALDQHGYPGLHAGVVKPLDPEQIQEARRLWTAAQQRRLPGAKNAVGGENDTPKALSETLRRGLEIFTDLLREDAGGVLKTSWRDAWEAKGLPLGSFDWMTKELVRYSKVRAPKDTTGRFLLMDATSSATSN